METVAWVGALETAIGILYLALIGQRSIAQWLDDRRMQRHLATPAIVAGQEVEQKNPEVESSSPPPQPYPLSVQSIGDYIQYVWHDPLEAALVAFKALTLGSVFIFGTATLLLFLSALVVEIVVFFSGSHELDLLAQRMAGAGLSAGSIVVVSGMLAPLAVMGLSGLVNERKREQERRDEEERRREQRKAQAARRQAAQDSRR